MSWLKDLREWFLHQPCATEGCPNSISRWIAEDVKVYVGGEPRIYLQNWMICPSCRQKYISELPYHKAIRKTLSMSLPMYKGRHIIGRIDPDGNAHMH